MSRKYKLHDNARYVIIEDYDNGQMIFSDPLSDLTYLLSTWINYDPGMSGRGPVRLIGNFY